MKAVGVDRVISPMFIHSYHNGYQRDMPGADQLGYTFNTLTLSAADVDEMHRAYLEDESVHLTVPMKKIYRIIALDKTDDIHVDLVHKVKSWKNAGFYTHIIPGTAWPILHTPASMQLLMWPNDDEDRPDLTTMLITVVPPMAMARLTTMDIIIA